MVQKNSPSPTARSRGRPRRYDPRDAIAKALDAFWKAGYAGTSLDDIVSATGMNRPSLYGAFGDKRALFLTALAAYRARGGGVMAAVEAKGGSIRERLASAYRAALDIYFEGEQPRGCFFTGAATVAAVDDPEIAEAIRIAIEEIDAGFVAMFAWARQTGQLPPEVNPPALGRMASSMIHSFSIRARIGTPRAELEQMAAEAVALLSRDAR